MPLLILLSIGGLLAGFLLLRRVPVVPAGAPVERCELRVSVIVPARNEADNLPALLGSLRMDAGPLLQVIVVDDDSTDGTSAVAESFGATVVASAALPEGWTGKTWALHRGADRAEGEVLIFLDADTWLIDGGYSRLVAHFAELPRDAALSVLPFHSTVRWCEELSLFFNILVAMGAGGFAGLDAPRLFGQSLLMRRELYARVGGHEAVRGEILENLHLARHVVAAGGCNFTLGGRGALEMRMFPHGFAQMRESWQKAFADGAGATSPRVLWLSVYWLGAAMLSALMLFAARGPLWPAVAALYLLNAAQVTWYARQLGRFRAATMLLYPIALAFYFAIFAQSLWRRKRRRPVSWRGRQL